MIGVFPKRNAQMFFVPGGQCFGILCFKENAANTGYSLHKNYFINKNVTLNYPPVHSFHNTEI